MLSPPAAVASAMKPESIHLLNRLLAILCRSFPQYLKWARPYVPSNRREVLDAIDGIVEGQDSITERISRMIVDADALPRTGEFPMEFTDMHDLNIDYLLGAAVEYQRQDIAAISELVDQLRTTPAAKAVAEEALGMARGHLDTLVEIQSANSAD